MLVPFLWYLETNLLLNMGSFILQREVWTRIQFQASVLMVHISVSGIAGEHDNYKDSPSENAVGIFY